MTKLPLVRARLPLAYLLLFSCMATAQPDFGEDDVDDEYVPPATPIDNPIGYAIAASLLLGCYYINRKAIAERNVREFSKK